MLLSLFLSIGYYTKYNAISYCNLSSALKVVDVLRGSKQKRNREG